jgi:hypothetical protein
MGLPIIRSKILPRRAGDRYRHRLDVKGGLEHLRGNARPHFSLTCWESAPHNPNVECSGGCAHGLILSHWPELADLAALHLADDEGAPMHAEANGWYLLAGYLGGVGERYHAGNSMRQHWKLADGTPCGDSSVPGAEFDGYRNSTPDECLALFAGHVRLSEQDAAGVVLRIVDGYSVGELRTLSDSPDPAAESMLDGINSELRARWQAECDAMRPRWAAEAAACVERHGLQLVADYGIGGGR